MMSAKDLWERNRNDPIVQKLNEGLKNSEQSKHDSNPSAQDPSGTNSTPSEILFGKNPKHVQSLKAKAAQEK